MKNLIQFVVYLQRFKSLIGTKFENNFQSGIFTSIVYALTLILAATVSQAR